MNFTLFCQNKYAFGILNPIAEELRKKKHNYIWFVKDNLENDFPYKNQNFTTSISELQNKTSDVIFVPGNYVPHYLEGLKVQIFHGLAGEKKGHFKIRHYFDLYLTQGPYFTNKFNDLKNRYKNFDVIETGWPKLDIYASHINIFNDERSDLLARYKATKIILFAPTFSPKLTSAPLLLNHIKTFANHNSDFLILIKFHPLMALEWIKSYKDLANEVSNIVFQEENNIIKFLIISDLLISDTSSVIYEFLLLNKPVLTFNNISKNIIWENSNDVSELEALIHKNLNQDPYQNLRTDIYNKYHPYSDGNSALRMVNAVEKYISENGVPNNRKVSLTRKWKIYSIFGKPNFQNQEMNKLTAIIPVGNEINNIESVIKSVDFADEILVVDSFSNDGTYEKALELADKVIRREYIHSASQKNWAIPQAKHEWILLIDADERVTPELKKEIIETLKFPDKDNVAYWIGRNNHFMGKEVKFSGWRNDKVIRLFKRDFCKYENKNVHAEIIADGPIGKLNNKFFHNSYISLDLYIKKMNRYAWLQAKDYDSKTGYLTPYHFIIKPTWRFFKHYILQLGFLDGVVGLTIASIQFYVVFMRYVKIWLLRKNRT